MGMAVHAYLPIREWKSLKSSFQGFIFAGRVFLFYRRGERAHGKETCRLSPLSIFDNTAVLRYQALLLGRAGSHSSSNIPL